MEYQIRGKSVTEKEAASWITKHGGQVFTFAACEPDNISRMLIAKGNKVVKVDKENEENE